MTFRGTVPLQILSVYAPTAMASEENKEQFYDEVTKRIKKSSKQGITLIMGDLNARIQAQLHDDEEGVGPHTFDASNTTLTTQSDEVVHSRQMLIDLLSEQKRVLANTLFPQNERNKATHKENKRHLGGPPFKRGLYEVLDCIIVPERLKHIAKNAESDTAADIRSDHYPLWARIKINLKERKVATRKVNKYAKCTFEEKATYNSELQRVSHTYMTTQEQIAVIKEAGARLIPREKLKPGPKRQKTLSTKERQPGKRTSTKM